MVDPFNVWLHLGEAPLDLLRALVILIFKKGDANQFSNYRPISLLNTIYKIYAIGLRSRLQSALSPHITATQYGFRANLGTADALFSARRAVDVGEATRIPVHLLLLDWEKAFDRISHHSIAHSLSRLQ
eukprot:11817190-Prorocentrum_lima.AAC.1